MQHLIAFGPVIGRTVETFHAEVGAGTHARTLSWRSLVLWLQMSTSRLVYLHMGTPVLQGASCADSFGYLSSIDACRAIGEQARGPRLGGGNEARLVTRIVRQPVLPDVCHPYAHHAPGAATLRYRAPSAACRIAVVQDGEPCYQPLQPQCMAEEVIWSSRCSREENERAIENFRARWAVAGATCAAMSPSRPSLPS